MTATNPNRHCPRYQGRMGGLLRWLASDPVNESCPGPNEVHYYDPNRLDDGVRPIPETDVFCCQDPVQLRTGPETVFAQQVNAAGQLCLRAAERPLGALMGRVIVPWQGIDAIPPTVRVLSPTSEPVRQTPLEDRA